MCSIDTEASPLLPAIFAFNHHSVHLNDDGHDKDVNLLEVSSIGADITDVVVTEAVKGQSQYEKGRLRHDAVVSNLRDSAYYVRISAYNRLGYGQATVFSASGASAGATAITPFARAPPFGPSDVLLSTDTSTDTDTDDGQSLLCQWAEPLTNGGNAITSYVVEWDIDESFQSECGEATCVQYVSVWHNHSSVASASGDQIKLTFDWSLYEYHHSAINSTCVAWDANAATFRDAIVSLLPSKLSNITVTREGDSTLLAYSRGYVYTVGFTAAPVLGNVPLLSITTNATFCDASPPFSGEIDVSERTYSDNPSLDAIVGKGKEGECIASRMRSVGKKTVGVEEGWRRAFEGRVRGRSTDAGTAVVACTDCVTALEDNVLIVANIDLLTLPSSVTSGPFFTVQAQMEREGEEEEEWCFLEKESITAADRMTVKSNHHCNDFSNQSYRLSLYNNVFAYEITDLMPGKRIYARVKAVNSYGTSVPTYAEG